MDDKTSIETDSGGDYQRIAWVIVDDDRLNPCSFLRLGSDVPRVRNGLPKHHHDPRLLGQATQGIYWGAWVLRLTVDGRCYVFDRGDDASDLDNGYESFICRYSM